MAELNPNQQEQPQPVQTLGEALQEGLETLALPEPTSEQWNWGFLIARRLKRVLYEWDKEHLSPDDFYSLIHDFAERSAWEGDAVDLVDKVILVWSKIKFPEEVSKIQRAATMVLRSDFRIELSTNFRTESATKEAAFIGTLAKTMQDIYGAGKFYLPTRTLADLLASVSVTGKPKSPEHANILLHKFFADGTLVITPAPQDAKRHGKYQSPYLQYFDKNERVDKGYKGLKGLKGSKGCKGVNRFAEKESEVNPLNEVLGQEVKRPQWVQTLQKPTNQETESNPEPSEGLSERLSQIVKNCKGEPDNERYFITCAIAKYMVPNPPQKDIDSVEKAVSNKVEQLRSENPGRVVAREQVHQLCVQAAEEAGKHAGVEAFVLCLLRKGNSRDNRKTGTYPGE